MKKSVLINCCVFVQIFGCISPSIAQRTPEKIVRLINESMGLRKELNGTIEIDTKNGTKLLIEFKKDPVTDHFNVEQTEIVG